MKTNKTYLSVLNFPMCHTHVTITYPMLQTITYVEVNVFFYRQHWINTYKMTMVYWFIFKYLHHISLNHLNPITIWNKHMNNTPGIDEMRSKQWWSMRNSRDRHVERPSPVGALNKKWRIMVRPLIM